MTIETQDDITAVEATPAAKEAPATPEVTETPASSEKPADDVEAQPPEQPEKPNGVQKRINELTAKAREAERRAQELERQLNERAKPSDGDAPLEKPVMSQFENYDDYVEALTDYKLAAREDAKRQQTLTQHKEQTQQLTAARIQAQVEKGRAQFEDFEQKVLQNPDLTITPSMLNIIADIDAGAEVAYHLANNPEVAADIASMSPTRQAIALGRIEATLVTQKPPAKTISKAPAPIGSQINGGVSPGKPDPNKMTDAEWFAHEQEQLKNTRR